MKPVIVAAREAKDHFAECVQVSQDRHVIVIRHSKPVAVIVGLEGEDLEDVLLGYDEDLWRTIAARRKSTKKRIPLAEVRRRLGMESEKEAARRLGIK